MSKSIATLMAVGMAVSMPTDPKPLSVRQDDSSLWMCRDNGCGDCPLYFGAGSGWPDCPFYTGDQLTDNGFPVLDSGLIQIFIDVPAQDPGCSTLIRTPVTPNGENCGGNVIVAQGETCAPIAIDNTFIVSFCCGTGDCTAAGAPGKRDVLSSSAAGGGPLLLHDKDGNVIEPHTAALLQSRAPAENNLKSRNPGAAAAKKLRKRDCDGFTVMNGPYTKGGNNYPISDVVVCGPTEGCQATLGRTVTESTSFSVEVSVGDPFGIVSVSAGVEFSKEVSQSFEGTWDFGPGERGYVVFIPYITCVEGHFTGDCDDDGVITEICGGQQEGTAIKGEQRAVLVRG